MSFCSSTVAGAPINGTGAVRDGGITSLLNNMPALPSLRAARIMAIHTAVGPVNMSCIAGLEHLAIACAELTLRAAGGHDSSMGSLRSLHVIIAEKASPETVGCKDYACWPLAHSKWLAICCTRQSTFPNAARACASRWLSCAAWTLRRARCGLGSRTPQKGCSSGRQAGRTPWTCTHAQQPTQRSCCSMMACIFSSALAGTWQATPRCFVRSSVSRLLQLCVELWSLASHQEIQHRHSNWACP